MCPHLVNKSSKLCTLPEMVSGHMSNWNINALSHITHNVSMLIGRFILTIIPAILVVWRVTWRTIWSMPFPIWKCWIDPSWTMPSSWTYCTTIFFGPEMEHLTSLIDLQMKTTNPGYTFDQAMSFLEIQAKQKFNYPQTSRETLPYWPGQFGCTLPCCQGIFGTSMHISRMVW
jgi:hypothetical protein